MGQAVTKAASSLVGARIVAPAASSSATSVVPSSSAVLPRGRVPPSSVGATTIPRHRDHGDDDVVDATSATSSLAARGRVHMARIAADVAHAARADDDNRGIGRIAADRPASGAGVDGGGGGDGVPEMPPDLLKFLNDAGPLRRVVDREYTSARVYDALSSSDGGDGGDGVRIEHAKLANARVRRRMPLVRDRGGGEISAGGYGEGKNDIDGTTTERTTNFSTVDRSKSISRSGFGVSRMDYHRALSRLGGMKMESGDAEWKGIVDDECERILVAASSSSSSSSSLLSSASGGTANATADVEDGRGGRSKRSRTFDELRDAALLEDSLRYIGLPVLMRDAEGDLIGVWHHKADDMRHSSGLRVVSDGNVQFVMLKEDEDVVVGK